MLTQILVSQYYQTYGEALAILRMYAKVAGRFPDVNAARPEPDLAGQDDILKAQVMRWTSNWWFSAYICSSCITGHKKYELAVSYVAPVILDLPFVASFSNAAVVDVLRRRDMRIDDVFRELQDLLKLACMHEGLITCEPHR